MGFRGEALASIAAVAQVEMKTRRAEDELGTFLRIENSTVLQQEPVQCPEGTSISMKNVFFNVPARRNFLKSNTTELRNIIDEFTRVAMAFPQVRFGLHSNGQQVFALEKGSLKQRIIPLLGNAYTTRLVPVHEETDYLNITGFVGKPETARKTRGDQYFFINQRFIKSPYLHHSVAHAFDDLLPRDFHPSYVLFIQLDPRHIDVNVHPTKQEIKFDDEKIVYAFVQAAVKHALAQFSIAPSLDFSLNADIQQLDAISQPPSDENEHKTLNSNLYQSFTQKNQAHKIDPSSWAPDPSESTMAAWSAESHKLPDASHSTKAGSSQHFPSQGVETAWQSELARLRHQLIEVSPKMPYADLEHEMRPASREKRFQWIPDSPLMQVHSTYIVAITNQGYLLIHQQAAHERVVYEQLQKAIFGKGIAAQQILFPINVELQPTDALLLQELLPDMLQAGYQVEPFGQNSFIIHGTPADVDTGHEQKAIEEILEHYKNFHAEVKFSRREKLMRTLAWQQSIKAGRNLTDKEMRSLVEQLFLCTIPNTTPSGKPTFVEYPLSQLQKIFG
jgi:DNA mismatch repair protein MutL